MILSPTFNDGASSSSASDEESISSVTSDESPAYDLSSLSQIFATSESSTTTESSAPSKALSLVAASSSTIARSTETPVSSLKAQQISPKLALAFLPLALRLHRRSNSKAPREVQTPIIRVRCQIYQRQILFQYIRARARSASYYLVHWPQAPREVLMKHLHRRLLVPGCWLKAQQAWRLSLAEPKRLPFR